MRRPGDLSRRTRNVGRWRVTLILAVIVLVIVATSLRGIASFYTDLLWFDSLGYRGVFTGVLGAKVELSVIFTLLFFAMLWVNLFVADRLAPRVRPAGPDEEIIERYQELLGDRAGLVRIAVAAVFALIAGLGVSGQWQNWLLFTHSETFGQKDPLFHKDAGFYIFKLPFLSFVVNWAFAGIVIILIITAVAHYLNGGIRVQGGLPRPQAGPIRSQSIGARVTPQVKAHVSVLLALLALVKAAGYYLDRFQLTLSARGTVNGATYTDVKAQLPAIELLILISLFSVGLFLVNIRRRGWVLPVLAVGLWGFVAVIVGTIYPALIQRFKVQPSESALERPYIARNIAATRAAMNLGTVTTTQFANDNKLTAPDLAVNQTTIRNIRLWDPNQISVDFQRLQGVKTYYKIDDVDIDRYQVNGQLTQVLLSARNLQTSQVPQSSWEARHLTYTHGYGVVAALGNAKDTNGRPSFLAEDIPTKTTTPTLDVTQPKVYFGEGQSGYVVVNTKRQEIDYEANSGTQFTTYTGTDGIGVGSILRKAAFALRFGDINPLISSNITGSSRILIKRDVRDRVQSLAPFLSFDADPYIVSVNGRLQWILDGYTTTSRYPYAQKADNSGLTNGSGLDHGFNYVRNSVKAVVDAYDGSVKFYVVDQTDPLIRSYEKTFPHLFTDGSQVSAELRAHFRYPEDLFRVQTNMWGRYHIDSPDDFYNLADAWNVSQDPGSGTSIVLGTQATNAQGQAVGNPKERRIDPYYLLMRLPGEQNEEFVLFRPFVPYSQDDSRKEMTSFMVAKSDPADYGKLEQFVMPPANLPDGPGIVASTMSSNADVAQLQTLLGQKGSDLIFGSLLVIPIEQSLLYVRPVYVEATTNQIPQLERVVVEYNGQVVVETTLAGALKTLFNVDLNLGEGDVVTPPGSSSTTPPASTTQTVAQLLSQASADFNDANTALTKGDLGTYQAKIKAAQELVSEAAARLGAAAPTTTTTTAPSGAGA
jgi:uncharacterized membrane protein (UPF0182 family)